MDHQMLPYHTSRWLCHISPYLLTENRNIHDITFDSSRSDWRKVDSEWLENAVLVVVMKFDMHFGSVLIYSV